MADETQAAAVELTPEVQALIDAAVEKATARAYEQGRKDTEEAMALQASMGAVRLTGPTHYLHLADGTVVDGTGAVPTHVSTTDEDGRERRVPVVAAWER